MFETQRGFASPFSFVVSPIVILKFDNLSPQQSPRIRKRIYKDDVKGRIIYSYITRHYKHYIESKLIPSLYRLHVLFNVKVFWAESCKSSSFVVNYFRVFFLN